jgi:hypothetical protein
MCVQNVTNASTKCDVGVLTVGLSEKDGRCKYMNAPQRYGIVISCLALELPNGAYLEDGYGIEPHRRHSGLQPPTYGMYCP